MSSGGPNRPSDRGGDRPVSLGSSKSSPTDPYDYDSIFAPEPDAPPLKDRVNMRLVKRIGFTALAILVLIVAAVVLIRQVNPAGSQGEEVVVQVPSGAGLNAVGALLAEKNVVPSALGFRAWDRLDRKNVQAEAGEYNFRTNSSASEAMSVLESGPKQVTTRLTISEGQRLRQIADTVGTIKGLSAEKFYEAATSGQVRSRYQPDGSTNLEGFVFPDTYLLSSTETEISLLQQMVSQADNVASLSGIDSSLSKISQHPYQTMIIASMIESEAKTDVDRAKISRVIQNRLFDAMPLQIDATVLYGIGNTKQVLSNRDLRTDTPYNTYTRPGLPPAPICNPGRESIEAAMNPVAGSWLYYVIADAEGNHAFADTFEEHERNIEVARSKGLL